MYAHNRMRWIWLATALLVAGLFAAALAAPLMAEPTARQGRSAALQALPEAQVAHLAPFAAHPNTLVDILVDGTPVSTGVAFADSTGYLQLEEGTSLVEIYPAGAITPATQSFVTLTEDVSYTLIAIGGANAWDLDLLALVDDLTPPAGGHAKVRIGHLAPFAAGAINTTADVRLRDGTVILDDVTYGDIAPYIELPAGTYDLLITSPDGSVIYIDPLPVTLADGDIISLFAVGDGENQPLGVFALPAGEVGFLLPLTAWLQVAHLAPFAMDPGTAVTVTLNGTAVLTDVEFADSTGYLPVPAGLNEIGIVPAGAISPAITGTFMFTHTQSFTLLAVGGANTWDLELLQLEDDLTPPMTGNVKVRIGHLAPFASEAITTTADVRLRDGTVILDDVVYGDIAPYMELPEGTYNLRITSPDGGTVYINLMPVTLEAGQILSLFAVGDGTNQPLGVFALPAGEPGFLLPLVHTTLYLPFIVHNTQP